MHCTTSPDGKFVYTASGRFGGKDAVNCYKVGLAGRLVLVQELMGEDLPEGFGGGNEIVVSPNGRLVAVACTTSDKLARFSRNPQSGELTIIEVIQSGAQALPGAAGVAFDSTGQHLLVADENSNSIVTFRNSGR
jgi:6-phosphogluconolactonase (cycloisomerase 2 family)